MNTIFYDNLTENPADITAAYCIKVNYLHICHATNNILFLFVYLFYFSKPILS